MHQFITCLSILFIYLIPVAALTQPITGRVIDGINQEPLPGAAILLPDQTIVTDEKGRFTLNLSPPIDLDITHVGYAPMHLTIREANEPLTITMEASITELGEVIVTASQRNTLLKNTPASVGIISRQMLDRDDQTLIAASLNRIPGVYMQSGTLSTNRITIRGIGARIPFATGKIRAYFNQIPLTNGVGETALEDIDMSLIERVEVIKGPNSSIYGAGLGGVINLKPTLSSYNHSTISVGAMLGSYGTTRKVVKLNHGNDHANFSVTYANMESEGYRENNQFKRESFTTMGQFKTGENGYISVLGNFISLKANIPSSINQNFYDSIPEAAAPNWNSTSGYEDYDKVFLGISYQSPVYGPLEQNTAVFIGYQDSYEPRPRPLNILSENTLNAGFRSVLKYNPVDSQTPWNASLGIEYFRDIYNQVVYQNLYDSVPVPVRGAPLNDLIEERYYYNLFAQADIELSTQFSIIAGVNLNQTHYNLEDFYSPDSVDLSGEKLFDPIPSPRLGMVYHLTPEHHLYANVSHGFSPPTLEETLNPDGALNPEIRPEIGWNFELGSRGTLFQGALSYDVSVYQMLIQDLLVARRTAADAFVGINAGETSHFGIEASFSYYHTLPNKYTLNYFANASIQRYKFLEFVDGDNTYSENQLTGTPSEMVNAGIDLLSPQGLFAHLNTQYISEIPLDDDNSLYAQDYLLTRLKAGYRFSFWKIRGELFGGINNLTNEKYASMLQINAFGATPRYYYPGLPRNYFGGLELKLEFQ